MSRTLTYLLLVAACLPARAWADPSNAGPHTPTFVPEDPAPPDPLPPSTEAVPSEAPDVPAPQADDDAPILGVSASAPPWEDEPPPTSPLAVDAQTGTETFAPRALAVVPRAHADAWLTLSPGLVRANHGGFWHASSLYVRGFDAGEGQSFAAIVEGAPLNEPSNAHGHGYLDLGLVIPEAIASVSVAQGVLRPEQPDFSVAGTARYALGLHREGAFGAVGLGSFRTYRLLAGYGGRPRGALGHDAASFFVVDAQRGDGFGVNRAHESVRLNARVTRPLDGDARVSIFVGSQLQRHDAAGVVRNDAFVLRTLPCDAGARAQFDCVVDPRQGGSAQRHVLAVTYADDALIATVHGAARSVRFREDFTGAVLDARGDGVDERYETFTLGTTGVYTHAIGESGLAARVGWDGRYDRGRTRMVRLRREDGVPYDVVFDSGLSLGRVGAFGAGAFDRELGRVRLLAELSLRVDGFAATIEHRDRPTFDRDGARLPYDVTDSFGVAAQPRGTIALRTGSGLSVRAASGLAARSNDAQALSDGERAPFTRVVATELGFAYEAPSNDVAEGLRADLTLFHTVVMDDLVFDPNAVRNVPVGRTRRYGGNVALTYAHTFGDRAPIHALFARGSATLSDARAVDAGRSALAAKPGAPLPFVPSAAGRLDVAYTGAYGADDRYRVEAGLGASFVGREPLPLGQRGEGYALLDAGLTFGFRHLDVTLAVENVTGTRYRSMELFTVADFDGRDGLPAGNRLPTRLYAAGAPRTVMLTVRVGAEPLRGGER